MAESRKTVFVACKLPGGLMLDAPTTAQLDDKKQLVDSGERDVSQRVTLAGTNSVIRDHAVDPESGGYGVTEVDADFWTDWVARHKDYPPVKNGLVFALPNLADVKREAKSRGSEKNGTEPLDPEKPAPGIQKADKA